jgi:hypothetical protein
MNTILPQGSDWLNDWDGWMIFYFAIIQPENH